MARRTLRDSFKAGFIAGLGVIHSQSLNDQQLDYWNAYNNKIDDWFESVFNKYKDKEIKEFINDRDSEV